MCDHPVCRVADSRSSFLNLTATLLTLNSPCSVLCFASSLSLLMTQLIFPCQRSTMGWSTDARYTCHCHSVHLLLHLFSSPSWLAFQQTRLLFAVSVFTFHSQRAWGSNSSHSVSQSVDHYRLIDLFLFSLGFLSVECHWWCLNITLFIFLLLLFCRHHCWTIADHHCWRTKTTTRDMLISSGQYVIWFDYRWLTTINFYQFVKQNNLVLKQFFCLQN